MKITGFRPLIVSKEAESIVKIMEDLGFERRHHKTGIENGENEAFMMKDANGNRISIAQSDDVPQDITGITINVDNFQEAYDLLLSKGFINPRGDKVTETGTSKATMLFAPSGFMVTISEHLK